MFKQIAGGVLAAVFVVGAPVVISQNANAAKPIKEPVCKTVTLTYDGSLQTLCKNDFTVTDDPTGQSLSAKKPAPTTTTTVVWSDPTPPVLPSGTETWKPCSDETTCSPTDIPPTLEK